MLILAVATLNLACKLHDDLIKPREMRLNGRPDSFTVKGGIRLKETSAHCSFWIAPTWTIRNPVVVCHESWLRTGADWHAYTDGSLCYVLDQEWHDVMNSVVGRDGILVAADAARLWITRNVAWLLSKHLMADDLGLTTWPADWPFWPHGSDQAKRKYAQRRQRI